MAALTRTPAPSTQQAAAPATTAARAPAPRSATAQPAAGSGALGWLKRAGQWMGEKVDSASKAVGAAVDRTVDGAREAWEAVSSTKVSVSGGIAQVQTDLDEILDVLPASARAALQLDRGAADNRAEGTFDPKTGLLRVRSAKVAVTALDTARVKTGAMLLEGLELDIRTTASGGWLGLASLGPGSVREVQVRAARLVAQDVEVRGGAQPVRVGQVEVRGLSGMARAESGSPMSAGAKSEAGFSIESAVLRGVRGAGAKADTVTAAGVSGGLSEKAETAFAEAKSIGATGVTQGGQRLGAAQVQGARVDVHNPGGGMVGLDNRPDRLKAKVAVSAASVQDFDGADTDVRAARVAGVQADVDTTTGAVDARLGEAQVDGLDTATVDARSATLRGAQLGVQRGGGRTRAALTGAEASVAGLRVGGPAGASGAGAPVDWSLGLDRLALADAATGGARVDGAELGGLQAAGATDGGAQGTLGSLSARGLRAGDAAVARLDGRGLRGSQGSGGAFDASATSLRAQGVDTAGADAAALSLEGASVRRGANGRIDGRVGSGRVDGLDTASVDARSAEVRGLDGSWAPGRGRSQARLAVDSAAVDGLRASAPGGGGGTTAGTPVDFDLRANALRATDAQAAGVGLGAGAVRGLQATGASDGDLRATAAAVEAERVRAGGASVGRLDATQLEASRTGGAVQGKVAKAGVSDVAAGDLRLAGASLEGATLAQTGDSLRGSAAAAQAEGFAWRDIRAGSARLAGADFAQSPDDLRVAAATGEINAFSARNFEAERLAVAGASARRTASGAEARVESGAATRARIAGRTEVGAIGVGGLQAGMTDTRRTVSAREATVRDLVDAPTGTRLGAGDIQNARFINEGGRVDAAADRIGLQNATGGGAQVAGVQVNGARVQADGAGFDARAARVTAQDARARLAGGAGGGGSSGVDTGRLIRSGAALVDDADLEGSVPLRAGELGAGLRAEAGTTASGRVSVRDGQIVAPRTGVSFSKPLDGPLWTGVKGVYGTDDQRMKADVRGFFDVDVGGRLNESLGLPGKQLPDVATLGAAAARTGAGGGGPLPVDLAGHRVDGSVALRGGTLDAGPGSVTLGERQRAGDNTVALQSEGRGGFRASMQRFLGNAFRWRQGRTQVDGGAVRAEDAQVRSAGGGQASVGSVSVDDLRVRGGR